MRRIAYLALALLIAADGAKAQSSDYRQMLGQLGVTAVRPGVDGMNPQAANPVNYDESRVGTHAWPDPLRASDGSTITNANDWWKKRRPQVLAAFETEIYGRVPKTVPPVRWEMTGAEVPPARSIKAITTHYIGHVDNRAYPALKVDIAVDVTLPTKTKAPVPVMIVLTWHGPWDSLPVPQGQGDDWRDQLLQAGWGYAEYIPTTVQPDDPKKLREGIIGLTNHGALRQPEEWGALRAWAWGASRVVDLLSSDRRVASARIGVAGHSRYGKAALVAMAFDERLAIGYISSSGAGGAKPLRRNFGETLENLAGEGEHHWMAGNFIAYAGPKTVADLPVDAHELLALCAPRPVFLGAGTREAGDGWVDPKGMFLAAVAAGPVYRLTRGGDLGASDMPPVGVLTTKGALAWRQHPFGHTMQPNWASFLEFAKKALISPFP